MTIVGSEAEAETGADIDLYTASTPNGWKASVTLEELGLPYNVHPINLGDQTQKEDWFLALNPNGRIPVIVDRGNDEFAVFETGAIMVYLADIANWCWVRTYKWSGISADGLPNLKRWRDAMRERPACQRGIEVPQRMENLVDSNDEEGSRRFAENARKTLQT
jgi:glutathione S-transferase